MGVNSRWGGGDYSRVGAKSRIYGNAYIHLKNDSNSRFLKLFHMQEIDGKLNINNL